MRIHYISVKKEHIFPPKLLSSSIYKICFYQCFICCIYLVFICLPSSKMMTCLMKTIETLTDIWMAMKTQTKNILSKHLCDVNKSFDRKPPIFHGIFILNLCSTCWKVYRCFISTTEMSFTLHTIKWCLYTSYTFNQFYSAIMFKSNSLQLSEHSSSVKCAQRSKWFYHSSFVRLKLKRKDLRVSNNLI